jgi:ferritin-like metal-binding protein YciE
MRTLNDLFLDELADRYDSEKRLVQALPKMAKAATCTHLQKLIQSHLKETESHVKKLERVFKCFSDKAKAKKCEATIGLLKEGDEIADDFKGSPAINAALISVAQKVEHYEIASYGCLREWAGLLGNKEAAGLLQEILVEEKAANHLLSELARFKSNDEAEGECASADSCADAKDAKPLNGRRGIRPINIGRPRPVSIAR